eukprot:s1470_g3.t1
MTAGLRLVFSGRFSLKQMKTLPSIAEQLSAASQTGPQLEAKAVDCRSPSQLAKADLPSTSCYFALFSREDLVFVHWCPDRMSRDHFTRMRDDSRYAVLKPAVMKLVMDAFDPQVRLLQVDAREPQELVDHANRADERMVADVLGSKVLVPQGLRMLKEDWDVELLIFSGGTGPEQAERWNGDQRRLQVPGQRRQGRLAEVTIPVAMPANLCFFLRPVLAEARKRSAEFEGCERLGLQELVSCAKDGPDALKDQRERAGVNDGRIFTQDKGQ